MKKSFKKAASLFLMLTLVLSLMPSLVAKADYYTILFSINQDELKNKNASSGEEYSAPLPQAYIGPTSAIGRFAKSKKLTYVNSEFSNYNNLDVSGTEACVTILDDSRKYCGIDLLQSDSSESGFNLSDIKSIEYYISSADMTDYYYDEDFEQVYFLETVYNENQIITAPGEMIDFKSYMTDYNSKTDLIYIEVSLYSEDITKLGPDDDYYMIGNVVFGPFVFRSQLNGHAGKLVEDIRDRESNEIYRIKNPKNNEKLYTTDENEVVVNCLKGWEIETSLGIGLSADDENAVPVYRLYNKKTLEHLYTTDSHEVEVLTSKGTWTSDNGGKPVFYGSNSEEGNNGVYRLVNAKGKAPGRRLLSADSYEIEVITTKSTYTVDNDNKPIFYISPISK